MQSNETGIVSGVLSAGKCVGCMLGGDPPEPRRATGYSCPIHLHWSILDRPTTAEDMASFTTIVVFAAPIGYLSVIDHR
jgi:hypothetical protein